jgi:uracil-DNA glycosylase family protein
MIRMTRIEIAPTFEAWQQAARRLLRDGVPPVEISWIEIPPGEPPAFVPAVGRVPKRFLDLARQVAGGRDAARWAVLYEALWRLIHDSQHLLEQTHDPLVRRLHALAAGARREAHQAEVEEMLELERQGGGAGALAPPDADLPTLQAAAQRCTGCELYRHATQVVFGVGPADARLVLVGEQPGDQEDLRGAPFVGPAGEVLDRALGEAGLDRTKIYVTNAVKHFKFVQRGKRRIHDTPRLTEVAACRPWLEAELSAIKPRALAALGATAARAIFGPDFRLMQQHGRFYETRWTPKTLATIHPSAVLRGEDEAAQERLYRMLADDLKLLAGAV